MYNENENTIISLHWPTLKRKKAWQEIKNCDACQDYSEE